MPVTDIKVRNYDYNLIVTPYEVVPGNQFYTPTTPIISRYTGQWGWAEVRVKTSVSTPNYRLKLKTGGLPINPYTVKVTKWEMASSNWSEQMTPGPLSSSVPSLLAITGMVGNTIYYTDMNQVGSKHNPADMRLNLIDEVNNKLLEKAKDMKTNIVQVYLERQQAIDMVAGLANKLGTAIRQLSSRQYSQALITLGVFGFKKKKSKRPPRIPKAFDPESGTWYQPVFAGEISREAMRTNPTAWKKWGSEWLAMQYGWKPLLQDIYGVCEELANRKTPVPPPRPIKASATRSFSETEVISVTVGTFYVTNTVTVIVRGGFVITAGPEHKIAKLGLSNPALSAWEIFPYSFIIDWFLPIGDFLSNLDAVWFQSATNGYISVKTTKRRDEVLIYHKSIVNSVNGDTTRYRGSSHTWIEEVSYDRSPISAFPTPTFPKIKNPLSLDHLYNALALFVVKK